MQAASVQKLCECLLTLATYSAARGGNMPSSEADGLAGWQGGMLPPAEGGRVAIIQTTQPALFERAGVSPRTGARALALLTRAGVVSIGRGSLTILDAQRLSLGARGELAAEGGRDGMLPPAEADGVAGWQGGMLPPSEADGVAGWQGGMLPPSEADGVAGWHGGEVQSLRGALASASAEVESLRAALAFVAGEVQSLRAEVAAARSSVASSAPALPAPTLTPPLDVDALVGRIVDALRVTLPATLPPATLPPTHPTAAGASVQAQGEGVEGATLPPATLPPSTTPTAPVKGRGSRGAADADDMAALQRLVSLAKDKRGKRGSVSGAAQLLGITEGGVRAALKAGRVTPELAARVRAALASLDAAEG